MSELGHEELQNTNFATLHAEHPLRVVIQVFLRHKISLLVITLVSAVCTGFVTWKFMPNWYSSTVNVVPTKNTSGGLFDNLSSGINSVLKDFGMNKVGGKSGETYSMIVVLQSRRLKDSLIEQYHLDSVYRALPAVLPLDTGRNAILEMFDENFGVTSEKEGNYTITALHPNRHLAVQMANDAVRIANSIVSDIAKKEASVNKSMIETRLRQNVEALQKATDTLKKFAARYKMFSPTDQAKIAVSGIAELKAETMKQELGLKLLEQMYGQNDPSVAAQKKLIDELRMQTDKIQTKPGFIGDFAINNSSDIAVEYMRLMTDVEVFTKLKVMITPMYEQAKIDENRETQSLIILDPAIAAEKKAKPKRSLLVLSYTAGISLLYFIMLVIGDRVRFFKQSNPEIFANHSR